MPLNAVDFVPKGPVKSADIQQFFNLFTGVMVDQPITFSNTLNVGGNQGNTTVPLKLYGAPGQTTHLLDLYPDRSSAQPGFGFSALGTFGWGPGGAAPIDTNLSRIGTQGHASDTPGLLVTPQLEVGGNFILDGSLTFPSGSAVADGGNPSTGHSLVQIGTDLAVQDNIYVGFDRLQSLREVRATVMGAAPILAVGTNADPWGSGLGYAEGALVVRGADLPDVINSVAVPFSAHAFAGNWVQINTRFTRVTAGVAWPGVAATIGYDVDASPGAGGWISFMAGKIGVSSIPDPNGALLQVPGAISADHLDGFVRLPNNVQIQAQATDGTYRPLLGLLSDNNVWFSNAGGSLIRFINQAENLELGHFDNAGNMAVLGNVQAATFNGQHLPLSIPATAQIRTGSGIFAGSNVGAGQGSSAGVTFSSPLPGVPSITVTQVQGASDKPFFTLQVEGPSNTGFTVHCQNTGTSTSNCVIDYIAIYGAQ